MPDSPPTTVYIALGANLGDRATNLRAALGLISITPGVRVKRVSRFMENPAVGGPPDSPPFLNAAAAIETNVEPHDLLTRLLEIERQIGRVRSKKNDPRPIDLDIILYGDTVIETPDLVVPHPLMHERRFVLQPLAEIAPEMVHPKFGKRVDELLRGLSGSSK
jgi:2-amino-4-hydroxy-6-hydroxymethyldihydropteridine diphosphokinase